MAYLNSRKSSKEASSEKSSAGKTYMETSSKLRDLANERKELMKNAAREVCAWAKAKNQAGESNVRGLNEELNKMLIGFTQDEQREIMILAVPLMIVNL